MLYYYWEEITHRTSDVHEKNMRDICGKFRDILFGCTIPRRARWSSNTFSMSSTRLATSSTSNIQLIMDAALHDYTKLTGIDLSKTPFASALEQSNSPEDILRLLQKREKAFKDYRDGYRKLISCLSPAVKVIQLFSGILGEAASLVSYICHLVSYLITMIPQVPFPPANVLFAGIDALLDVCPLSTFFNRFPVMNVYARLPVELHHPTMPFSSSSSAWETSSSVWRFIRRCHSIRQ
jgi:hypothetical protein